MNYIEVREMLLRHWTYTGGPNEAHSVEIYHDDALLELPQSHERFRGKANIQGWREKYPAQLDFEPREIRGAGDFWIAEGTLRYDGAAMVHFVKIMEFREGRVQRETLYFAEPFSAPEWREPWRAEGPLSSSADLPIRIRGGS